MTLPENLVKKMKLFQADNHLPVHLKGGPADRILFGITVALCGIGLINIAHMAYVMGFTKKKA